MKRGIWLYIASLHDQIYTEKKLKIPGALLSLPLCSSIITMSSHIKLPTNFQADPLIQIRWNTFFRVQCEKAPVAEKHKDCKIILGLWYDPTIKRLVPVESSSK
jgi:hypothetical protein